MWNAEGTNKFIETLLLRVKECYYIDQNQHHVDSKGRVIKQSYNREILLQYGTNK